MGSLERRRFLQLLSGAATGFLLPRSLLVGWTPALERGWSPALFPSRPLTEEDIQRTLKRIYLPAIPTMILDTRGLELFTQLQDRDRTLARDNALVFNIKGRSVR